MAVLTNMLRRILNPTSFPRFKVPLGTIEPKVYQPPTPVKTTSVPDPAQPTLP